MCLEEKDLARSHVLPEFFYGPVYDETKRFVSLSSYPLHNTRMYEHGFREHLLCRECEGQFSRYEAYAAGLLRKIDEHRTPDGRAIMIPGFDYRRFKLFGLSLLWRSHVTRLHMFGAVKLGAHAEKIRAMLAAEDPGEPSTYCFAVLKIEGSKSANTVIQAPAKIRFREHNAYVFLAYGYEWLFIVSGHSNMLPADYPFVGMKPELVILIQNRGEAGFIREVRRRLGPELIEKAKRYK